VTLLAKLLVAYGSGALGIFVVLMLVVALVEAWKQSWANFTIALVLIKAVVVLPVGIWLRTR
jgi:hypothetical protein